jgi:large-conductance mechanosensitive channel
MEKANDPRSAILTPLLSINFWRKWSEISFKSIDFFSYPRLLSKVFNFLILTTM